MWSDPVENVGVNQEEQHVLQPLPIRKRQLAPVGTNQYCVTSRNGERKNVEANTAYEAFKLAGVSDAIKIDRLVNLKPFIIDKTQMMDETQSTSSGDGNLADIMNSEVEHFEQIKLLNNPVISADDLDKIMRGFHDQMLAKGNAGEAVVSSATAGTEIHGDGFDEIIPTNNPVKPQAKAVGEVKETKADLPQENISAAVPAVTPVPEKALSPEEVDKLLNSNKS